MEPPGLRSCVEAFVRRHSLIEPGGEVTCLVSGGADSTCLWHVLRELGYQVSALHVNHALRGNESEDDARFCRDLFDAEVVDASNTLLQSPEMPASSGLGNPSNTLLQSPTEAELRETRYSFATDRLRATGHTASDQLETVIYRLVSSGRPGSIKLRREDGVVRPLLSLWREETEAYCAAEGLPFRSDTTNPDTKRGLIRRQILPLLERLDPRARASLLALAESETDRPRLPRQVEETLASLLSSREGTKEADLGKGVRAVREYDRISLEQGPVHFGPWTIQSDSPGLEVRTWRPGDRLAGRRKKIQDVFTDAKMPRRERHRWPLVVREDEVVCVPGIVETPEVQVTISRVPRGSPAKGASE